MSDWTFPTLLARIEYVEAEARKMLRFNWSYKQRAAIVADAKLREMADHGRVGPHCLLLEPEVRSAVNRRLDASPFAVGPSRSLLWLPPEAAKTQVAALYSQPTTPADLCCLAADGSELSLDGHFDLELPPVRFRSLLMVSALRPGEHDDLAGVVLGGAIKESQVNIERIIDETQLLQNLRAGTRVYLLLDGGGVYKFAKSRGHCDFCGISRAVLGNDSSITYNPRFTATAESLNMATTIPPANICSGLLHGLCTMVLRIRKHGLTDGERGRLDSWYAKKTGGSLVRTRPRAVERRAKEPADPQDGKLEIAALDSILVPDAHDEDPDVDIGAPPGAGDPAARRAAAAREKSRAQFERNLASGFPDRWHPTLRTIRELRCAHVLPDALKKLGSIHDDFIRLAPDRTGERSLWTVGCHFVSHTLAFVAREAAHDLHVVHEQLAERMNQRAKRKISFWSGDCKRAFAAMNAQRL